MADSVNTPIPQFAAHVSAWAPLREPLFRSLWLAAVISYTGRWMQNVGAGWSMTQLTMSPFMVSMVQAAQPSNASNNSSSALDVRDVHRSFCRQRD